jgi:hypothetical protein
MPRSRTTGGATELTAARFVDEQDWGFGWISTEQPYLRLTSHALRADGGVWLVDPAEGEGVEERVRALGEPAGVLQLLDRHNRACAAFAERLGVPHHRVPFDGVGPFETVPVTRRRRWWKEVALWWPEQQTLVVAEAVATTRYFPVGGDRVGVHPVLKLTPPRRLRVYEPEHLLVGHGEGVHGPNATAALHQALDRSRLSAVRWAVSLPFRMWRKPPGARGAG